MIGHLSKLVLVIASLSITACQSIDVASPENSSLSNEAQSAFNKYSQIDDSQKYKIFYLSDNKNEWGYSHGFRSIDEALDEANKQCEKKTETCELYAIGNNVVYQFPQGMVSDQIENYEISVIRGYMASNGLGNRLFGKDIRKSVSEKIAQGVNAQNFGGMHYKATFFANGELVINYRSNHKNPTNEEKGAWWVRNDELCINAKGFYTGKSACFRLTRTKNIFEMRDSTGWFVTQFRIINEIS